MISRKQVTGDSPIPEEFEIPLGTLLNRVNMLCQFFGSEPMVSSGYRTMAQHKEIYRRKGITEIEKIPMASRHLCCQAIDLYDPERKLQKYILSNEKLMEEIGLWFEDFAYTKTWVHLQICAPRSGNRFFIP